MGLDGPKKPAKPGTEPLKPSSERSKVERDNLRPLSPKGELFPGERKNPSQGGLVPEREGLGEEGLTRDSLASLSPHLVAEHLMLLLAKKRAQQERQVVLEEVGDLVLSLPFDPTRIRRILVAMPEAGRIVDIYPLEVLTYVLERKPELLPRIAFEPFIRNRKELEEGEFLVDASISIQIPLPMKVRAFALDGGGFPGYCLSPGAPGEYILELGDEGSWTVVLRGELRKKSLIDRVTIKIIDPGDSSPNHPPPGSA